MSDSGVRATQGSSCETLTDLKALAERATPGPWFLRPFDEARTLVFSNAQPNGPYVASVGIYDEAEAQSIASADFIAAANPKTVLALLNVVEAARRMETFVWANPGYPPSGGLNEERLHAGAKRRQELAREVFDAIAVLERGE